MTLRLYIGSAGDIQNRLLAAPDTTQTTVNNIISNSKITVVSATSFSIGDTVVIGRERCVIADIVTNEITLENTFKNTPQVGQVFKHYDADYSLYRDIESPFVFIDDIQSGGQTGNQFGQEISVINKIGDMPAIEAGLRVSIFDDTNPLDCLFGGVITGTSETKIAKDDTAGLIESMELYCQGYQSEADSNGIEEEPVVNINAGKFLKYLCEKYTTLAIGEIDEVNSPTVDYIRLSSFRRFSQLGQSLQALWPGSEFVIKNDHTNGVVYFRQAVKSYAPMVLNEELLTRLGRGNVKVEKRLDRTFNRILFPHYQVQTREPDFHIQDIVANESLLKTSITLNGIPVNVEESMLVFDDFSDNSLSEEFVEDDLNNTSPPPTFAQADGFLLEGTINNVTGLHLVNTTGSGAEFGDIGRQTDPAIGEPFTGEERQLVFMKELVVQNLGECIPFSILNQDTVQTTVVTGSTTTVIPVVDASGFSNGDKVTVGGVDRFINSIASNTITLTSALPVAPSAGATFIKHRLAKSRVLWGIALKSSGALKYIRNGVEFDFSPTRTYTGSPTTYSIRLFMQSFDTFVSASPTISSVQLSDASQFTTGDVVDIYTAGSRVKPERRVITKSGSVISYADTTYLPKVGYRVKTLPKIVVQIKGGTFGSITGRDWTTIHTEPNTWQTTLNTPPERGLGLFINKSLIASTSLFQCKNPVGLTANIGARYLHLATQDVDTAELDVDAIVRKVGDHYQLDFFPDTKQLWSSGSRLQLQYDEKFRHNLLSEDFLSMREVAKIRGHILTGNETQQELVRLGGRTLDTVQLTPNPLKVLDALSQSQAILDAVKDLQVITRLVTNTYTDTIVKAGQTIISELSGVPNLEVKRIQLSEIPANGESGQALFSMQVTAGSIDQLKDLLLLRDLKAGNRLVIDDGQDDDSFTRIERLAMGDNANVLEIFSYSECLNPSSVIRSAGGYTELRCLLIP